MNENTSDTMLFRKPREKNAASDVLMSVYITSYNNARYRICSLQRDELVEELVRFYVQAQDVANAEEGQGR